MSEIFERKRLLRRRVLAQRRRIPPEQRAAAAEQAAARFLEAPEVREATVVMGFASFGGEISTDPLVHALLERGAQVLMPYVEGSRLRGAPIRSLDDLAPGYRGIREPPRPQTVPPEADVILVPGVAFDERGRRLGYGGGFYDRLLGEARGLRIGYCYDCQIVDEVPVEPHDVPVALVVSESRAIRA